MDQIYLAGTQNIALEIMMRNSTTGEGVTGLAPASMMIAYIQEGGAADVTVTPVAATLGTYTSGGWVQVDATNMPGLYQFGVPNAALSGANSVTFIFQSAGCLNKYLRIVLTQADLRNSTSLGVSDISNTYVLANNTYSFISATMSGMLQRVLSLVGDNQGVPSGSVTLDANGNPLSYVICGYDTEAHAATNDGVTGVINKVQVTNTYNSSGWSSSTIQRIT